MTARFSLLPLAGLLVGGLTATPAVAADFGISFHYSSYAPACYSSQYYGSYYPQTNVYYEDYCEPLVYAGYSSPRVIVYDECYPTTYRTTYTRSRHYTRPVRRAHPSIHYRSSRYRHHAGTRKVYDRRYRSGSTSRQRYAKSRPSRRVYTSRHGGLRYRSSDSYSRLRSSLYPSRDRHSRYQGSRDRHSRYQGSRYRLHRTPGSRRIRR